MALTTANMSATANIKALITKAITTGAASTVNNYSRTGTCIYTLGSGANQCNEVAELDYTVSAGATQTIDLYGSLTNPLGETVNFARIKAIYIEHVSTSVSSSISYKPAAANPFLGPLGDASDQITIRAGGFIAIAEPGATAWAVTNGASDSVRIINNDGSNAATVKVTFLGATS